MSRMAIISDTHDHLKAIDAAVDLFNDKGCKWIIHLGDFETTDALKRFQRRNSGVTFAWVHGQKHDRFDSLKTVSDEIGGLALSSRTGGFGMATVLGARIGLCHSTYERVDAETRIYWWCVSNELDFVFYGHVHYFNIKFPTLKTKTVLLNPGGFYQAMWPWTVCVLDLDSKEVGVYAYGTGTCRFRAAVSFGLHNRSATHGEYYGPFKSAINHLRLKNTRFWSPDENAYLGPEPESWLDIEGLCSGKSLV